MILVIQQLTHTHMIDFFHIINRIGEVLSTLTASQCSLCLFHFITTFSFCFYAFFFNNLTGRLLFVFYFWFCKLIFSYSIIFSFLDDFDQVSLKMFGTTEYGFVFEEIVGVLLILKLLFACKFTFHTKKYLLSLFAD